MASNGSASAPSLHEDDDYDPGADAEASDHLLAGHSKADRGLILVLLLKCAKDMFKRCVPRQLTLCCRDICSITAVICDFQPPFAAVI